MGQPKERLYLIPEGLKQAITQNFLDQPARSTIRMIIALDGLPEAEVTGGGEDREPTGSFGKKPARQGKTQPEATKEAADADLQTQE